MYLWSLVSINQASPLTLYPLVVLVSLFFLWAHAYITQFFFFISRLGLSLMSLLIVLRPIWCSKVVFGNVFNLLTVVMYLTSLKTIIFLYYSPTLMVEISIRVRRVIVSKNHFRYFFLDLVQQL